MRTFILRYTIKAVNVMHTHVYPGRASHQNKLALSNFWLVLGFIGFMGYLSPPVLGDSEREQTGCADGVTPECLVVLALADATRLEATYWKDLAHVAIASAQLEYGDVEGARGNLRRASEHIYSGGNEFNRAEVLIEMSVVQAELGDLEAAETNIAKAISVADVITLPDWRYWALSFVPRAKAKTCAFLDAKESIGESLIYVKLIDDIVARASASTHIASAQVEVGDSKGAMRTVERILKVVTNLDDEYWKTELLLQVALLQAKVGDVEAADRSIVEVSAIAEGVEASWRYWRLSQIVLVQAQIGKGLASRGLIIDLVNILEVDIADESLVGWRTFAFANLSKALAIVETREGGRVPASLLAARLCA